MYVCCRSLTQWLPHTIKAQWIYLLYRIIVAFYFLVWLLAISINAGSANILLFLTQWSFIVLNAYLLVALLTTVINFIRVYVYPQNKRVESTPDNADNEDYDNPTVKCCRYKSSMDQITLVDKLTWFLFLVGTQSALLTVLLFWILIGNAAEVELSVSVNVHVHVLNGIVALVEVWVTGIPIHLLHFVYMLLFAGSYGVFTGIHYGVNGTGIDGERYIYRVLDYDSQPGVAAGTVIICTLVVCPLLHLFFYLLYLLRHWLTSHLQDHFKSYHKYYDPIDMSAPIPVL